MDNDSGGIQATPCSFICRLVPQRIQVFYGYVLTGAIAVTIDGDCRRHFQMRLYQHLTVLSEDIFAINHDETAAFARVGPGVLEVVPLVGI